MTPKHRLALYYGIFAIVLLFSFFPVFWVISLSFKNFSEFNASKQVWWSANPSFANYFHIFARKEVTDAIVNSIVVSVSATLLAVLVGFPTAYAISRRGTRLRWLFVFTLIPLLTPPVVLAIPGLVFYSTIGLANSVLGLTLFYVIVTVFFVVWMTKPFIDSVHTELEDTAIIEGVSRYKIPFTVVLPLVKGGLAAAAIFVFILNWTEFVFALALNSNGVRTIPVTFITIGALGSRPTYFEGDVSAFGTISLIPFFIFVYYFQKYMLKGLTLGAFKMR